MCKRREERSQSESAAPDSLANLQLRCEALQIPWKSKTKPQMLQRLQAHEAQHGVDAGSMPSGGQSEAQHDVVLGSVPDVGQSSASSTDHQVGDCLEGRRPL